MAITDEQSVDRRAQILDAAVVVISRRGVDRARLADVAEEAGVSLGLVQHYFRTRERLLIETFRREQERISQIWHDAVPDDADPLTRLAEYLRLSSPEGSASAATPFDPGWSFWLEFWSKANRDDEIRAEVSDIYGDFAELYREAIREGVDRLGGTIYRLDAFHADIAEDSPRLRYALTCWTGLNRAATRRWLRGEASREATHELLTSTLEHVLLPFGAPAAPGRRAQA